MQYPKISIVTPSYNQGQFLEETIQSILSQGYPNLEYIIVDGGSTDNSVEIIKKYEKQLTWWCCETDKGHANALNKGFKKCTGDIITWLNSDDKYFPWALQTVAEIFTQFPEVEWLSGQPSFLDKIGRLTSAKPLFLNKYDYLAGNYEWIQQESVFWRKSLWEKAGGYMDEKYKLMIDGELWSRFFQHTNLFYTNLVLSSYRNHLNNRAIQNNIEIHSEMKKIISTLKEKEWKTLTTYAKVIITLKKIHLRLKTKILGTRFTKPFYFIYEFILKIMVLLVKINQAGYKNMSYFLLMADQNTFTKKFVSFKID